jgi:hypothetical protein
MSLCEFGGLLTSSWPVATLLLISTLLTTLLWL